MAAKANERRAMPPHQAVPHQAVPHQAVPHQAVPHQAVPHQPVSRRAVLGGAGAGVLAVGGLVRAAGAEAKPVHPHTDVVSRAAHPDGVPVSTTIGSGAISGYSYQTACMYDFQPFNPASQRTWGGSGVYTAGTSSPLRATFDLPAGVLVRDVEWYVHNGSASTVYADLFQFAPGMGSIYGLGATASIAPSSAVSATRVSVPASAAGPFPLGSKLLASLTTSTDGTVQVNGVRVGFSAGQGGIGLLPTPVRAYDSRHTGGKLRAGSTRTITLPASIVPPGTTGVLVNITAANPSGSGYLKVYPGNASAPAASALNYHSDAICNALLVGVSNSRKIKIYTSRAVHVVVDVTGTVA